MFLFTVKIHNPFLLKEILAALVDFMWVVRYFFRFWWRYFFEPTILRLIEVLSDLSYKSDNLTV